MNPRLTLLKLTLDELQVPFSVGTIDDRKRVQKAIYLAQVAGLDLGYRFGWYLLGPYSPDLTKDYFALASHEEEAKAEVTGKKLVSSAAESLRRVAPLLAPPTGWKLGDESWLELLASYHYLRKVSRLEEEEAVEQMKKSKEHLVEHVPLAKGHLRKYALVP